MLGITDTRLDKFPNLRPRHILICRYMCCSICGFVIFDISFYFVSSGFIVSMRTVIYFLIVKLINGKNTTHNNNYSNFISMQICERNVSSTLQNYELLFVCLMVFNNISVIS